MASHPLSDAGTRTILLVHALYPAQVSSLAKIIPGDLIEMRCGCDFGAREFR